MRRVQPFTCNKHIFKKSIVDSVNVVNVVYNIYIPKQFKIFSGLFATELSKILKIFKILRATHD